MATASAVRTATTTVNTATATAPPLTMATAPGLAVAGAAVAGAVVVAPAQLLRLPSQQQRAAQRLNQQQMYVTQFHQEPKGCPQGKHQIHPLSALQPNVGANCSSSPANCRPSQQLQLLPQQTRQITAAASDRLALWRSSPSSSPPQSSVSAIKSGPITRSGAHQPIRLRRLALLENTANITSSTNELSARSSSSSSSSCGSGSGSSNRVDTQNDDLPVGVTSLRHRSEAEALALALAADATSLAQQAVNSNHKKLIVAGSTKERLPRAENGFSQVRHANLSVAAAAARSNDSGRLTATPAPTNSRLRQGVLYARRHQYHITGPRVGSLSAAVTSLSATSAKCNSKGTTTTTTSAATLAPLTLGSTRQGALVDCRASRTLAAVGRVCPLTSGSRIISARSVANLSIVVVASTNSETSRSSSSAALAALQLIHSRNRQKKQQLQQSFNCRISSRFLRSSAISGTQPRTVATVAADRATTGKFSLSSSTSSSSSLALCAIKRTKPYPKFARRNLALGATDELKAAPATCTRIGDDFQQKRSIGLSRRSNSSGSEGCCGGSDVKRLTSLNNSNRFSQLAAAEATAAPVEVDDNPQRRPASDSNNRSTLATAAAEEKPTTATAAAYLTAPAQRSEFATGAGVSNVPATVQQHANRKPATSTTKTTMTTTTVSSRSSNIDGQSSGASAHGASNNNINNNNDVDINIATENNDQAGNLAAKSIITNHGNHMPFSGKSSTYYNQQQQQHQHQHQHHNHCQSSISSKNTTTTTTTSAPAPVVATVTTDTASINRDNMKIQSEPIVNMGKDKRPIRIGPPDIPIRSEPISDYYDLEARPFARGKFAQVKRCINKSTKQCFAAKCIKKRRRLVDIRHEILLEIEALKLSYHTHRIVKLFEVFETPTEMTLILEMANGGELQRVLDEEEVIDERLVKRMIKQILEGLVELHDIDIAHLDIKPQNLLLTEKFPHGDIKLCDFGISRRITKDCEIREICGTPDYVAPEILSYDPISLATDMWSLGVLTYVLLSGYSPFGSEDKQQTFCNITQATLDFPSEIFEKISEEAIDFMRKLILREPSERLTSRQAKSHSWLN